MRMLVLSIGTIIALLALGGATPVAEAGGGGAFECLPGVECPGSTPLWQPVRVLNNTDTAIAALKIDLTSALWGSVSITIDVGPGATPGSTPPGTQPDYYTPPPGSPGGDPVFVFCGAFPFLNPCWQTYVSGRQDARIFGFTFESFDPGERFDFGFDADLRYPPNTGGQLLQVLGPWDSVAVTVVLDDWPAQSPCLQIFDPVGPMLPCGTRLHPTPQWLITDLDQAYLRDYYLDPMGRTMVINVGVPAPASLLLLGLGLGGLGLLARRRRRK